jgi:hypothetical protein
MYLKPIVSHKVQSSILITGSARSGTSMIGSIIHSFKGVEYSFEPPTLISLFSIIEKLPKDQWRLIFETYIYEDFFLGAISGRNLNFNSNDDSCVYRAKSEKEIKKRLSKSLRKTEIESLSKEGIIAFKIPDIVPFLSRYLEIIPSCRIIFMKRNPIDTINSLLKKGWFSDHSLNIENRIYPFQKYEGNFVPYWVSEEDFDYWLGLTELDRCAYYFIKMNEPPSVGEVFVLNYDKLLTKPKQSIIDLCNFLRLEFGNKTKSLIQEIVKSNIRRDHEILNKINLSLKEKILDNYKQ